MNSAAKPNRPEVAALLFRRVGDSLLATPALRAVKKSLANHFLRVIVEPHVKRVFLHNPWVDEIAIVDRSDAIHISSELRRYGRPDTVIDFLSDPRSAVASFLSRARVRVGFDHSMRRHLYTHTAPLQDSGSPLYSAQHKLLLARPLGVQPDDLHTDFFLSLHDEEFAHTLWRERGWQDMAVAAFFIHSRRDYKRWPLSHFAKVVEHLQKLEHFVPLILNTPDDEAATSTLASMCHLNESHIVELRDLGHLAAVLKRCSLLIGNDGGPKHLAVAMGTPTVTIFRDEEPEYWTPPNSPLHVAISAAAGRSVLTVTPQSVIDAVDSLLPSPAQ